MVIARLGFWSVVALHLAMPIAACSSGDDATGNGAGGAAGAPFGSGGAGAGGVPFGSGSVPVGSGSAPPGSGGAGSGGLGSGGSPPGGGGSAASSAGGFSGDDAGTGDPGSGDPGAGPWEVVPPEDVLAVCKLDPALLEQANATLNVPWLVIRYGKLCYESPQSAAMVAAEAWSTTKTLGALAAGVVSYETRDIPRTGRKTGPFSDEDRADHWLDAVTYNPEALVIHVLSMVAHNPSLALGQKTMQYDTVGTVQINSISTMLNAAIQQDTVRLGANLEEFTQRFVFGPLGMTSSSWTTGAAEKNFAFSWSTTARDMARLGLLMLHGGMWDGARRVDAEWIHRMTHPAFEDGNTGYGYLTWLNAASNHHFGGIPGAPVGLQQTPQSPGPCAPVSVWNTFPHAPSTSPDCNYAPPYTCEQQFDVGVWQAVGLGGQVIQGHPGLDMVVVGREVTPLGTGPSLGTGPAAPGILWDAVRPAVIAADPTFAGDDAAFCAAYGGNTYAPDLP